MIVLLSGCNIDRGVANLAMTMYGSIIGTLLSKLLTT